jgi:cation:H+ antiporter
VLFVFYFCAYTAYLLLAAAQHAVLQGFNMLMLYFVIPITVLTLGVLAVRAYRSQK